MPIAGSLCIVAGILVEVFWTRRRWLAAGDKPDDIVDVPMYARSASSAAGSTA